MKRFFSLMLVALLLVSAIPFQAFATGTPVVVYVGEAQAGANHTYSGAATNWLSNIVTALGYDYNRYHISNYDNDGVTGAGNASVTVGAGTLYIRIKEHTYGAPAVTAATCETDGKKVSTCSTCGYEKEEKIAATGHNYGTGTVTTTANCNTPGERTYTCTNAGCETPNKYEVIAATNAHVFNAAGTCTVCGGSDNLIRNQVTFFNAKAQKVITETFIDGASITVPSGELISNYTFRGWWSGENGSGTQLTSGMVWDEAMSKTWYAWYVYDPANDGMSTITVTARCYIDGIGSSYEDVLVLTQALPDNTNVFDWLTSNKNTTILNAVYSKVNTNKYEWKNRYFYNHNGNEVLTEQSTFADGPKNILIKLEEKDNTTRANVQLYLHSSSTSENPFRILDMNGYTSGMNVTRTAAANLIKEYYSYKNVGNLYTDAAWNALMNGENATGATSIAITDNGTYKIHVVVTNASTKSSSTADSSNPKTGDYITIAVGTMVLAAAALVTVTELKKRKMI